MPESLPELFAWKRQILPQLGKVPFIEGETPVVCAWYPIARMVLLWNLAEQREEYVLRHGDMRRQVSVEGLGISLIEGIGV